MELFFKYFLYFFLSGVSYLILVSKNKLVYSFRDNTTNEKSNCNISSLKIFIVSLLWGTYSILCSKNGYSMDRYNYAYRFERSIEKNWTIGLQTISKTLHYFTNNACWLFFAITFITVMVVLFSIRSNDNCNHVIIYLFAGNTIIQSFYLLKQAPAVAFGTLGTIFLFKEKKMRAIICIVIAICFHEVSIILIPVYIFILGRRKKWLRVISYISIILILLFFTSFFNVFFGFMSQWLPDFANQADIYMDETGLKKNNYALTVLIKGLPLYIVTLYGFINHEKYKLTINNYEVLMFISLYSSICFLFSIYLYWLFRLCSFFYIPIYFFASEIIKTQNITNKKEIMLFRFSFFLSLLFFNARYLYQIYFNYGGF